MKSCVIWQVGFKSYEQEFILRDVNSTMGTGN